MLQIRTTINSGYTYLDLYKNEPVFLSLSFAEIQDITKKNSNFSKSFALPGSKNNNLIFNFFYDLNAIPTTFNPNNKFEASLLWDGWEIMNGYIRLNGTVMSNGEIIYQITFYNQVGDLMANIGDKFLVDLNLEYLNHPYSEEVILQSNYDPNLFPLTGTTDYSYQNGKTMWGLFNIGYNYISGSTVDATSTPLVQFTPTTFGNSYTAATGNFDFSGTPVHDYYYKPAIQIKELYEEIVREAGYIVESDFFNTAYFKRFYMPLKFVNEGIYSRNAIQACYTVTDAVIPPLESPNNRFFIQQTSGVTCNTLNFSATSGEYSTLYIPAEYSGTYTIRFTFDVKSGFPCTGNIYTDPKLELTWVGPLGVDPVLLYSNIICSNTVVNVSFEQTFTFTGEGEFSFFFLGEGVQVTNYVQEFVGSLPTFIPVGTEINYDKEFPANDYKQIDFITSVNKYYNLVVVPNPDKQDYLIVEPLVDYVGKGEVLDWTTKIDFNLNQSLYPTSALINGTLDFQFKLDQDYANQDFNSQTNRIFGTDKFKLNLEYKDTVTKFDYIFSSPIDITISNAYVPLITLSSMSKLKQIDKDGATLQTFVPFKILPKTIFRGLTLPNDNYGYLGNGEIIESPVNCTSAYTINILTDGWMAYTDCFGVQGSQYVYALTSVDFGQCINIASVSSGPLFPGATYTIASTGSSCSIVTQTPLLQYWYMNQFQMDRFTNLNRFTTYPFSFTGLSHYINFRGEDQTNISPAEYSFVAKDLYNVYYEDYVNDIISEENKIYSAKIYLYPQDVKQLRWNERILVNNTYFRINKITNFNALEPGICDIELVKLTKNYDSHLILYYKLTACDLSETLYSNSDLMYNLFAYNNNYVKIYDEGLNYLGCYFVEIDTYDVLKDYQHYWLSNGFSTTLVGVYPDCACTGRTQFNIVNEEPITTPVPVPPCECYDIGFTNESLLFPCVLTYVDCDGVLQSLTVPPNISSSPVCMCRNTITIISGGATPVENASCIPLTPTPTPTSVTPTPTPTITPTPTVGGVPYNVQTGTTSCSGGVCGLYGSVGAAVVYLASGVPFGSGAMVYTNASLTTLIPNCVMRRGTPQIYTVTSGLLSAECVTGGTC
jgi:hypothetical protein